MLNTNSIQQSGELNQLCVKVRDLTFEGDFEACEKLICEAMEKFPHAPQPHNLFGILLEKLGDHPSAMKHFRAAWALDPTYLPANHNLHTYGSFFSQGRCAFDEDDLPKTTTNVQTVLYDKEGEERVILKK